MGRDAKATEPLASPDDLADPDGGLSREELELEAEVREAEAYTERWLAESFPEHLRDAPDPTADESHYGPKAREESLAYLAESNSYTIVEEAIEHGRGDVYEAIRSAEATYKRRLIRWVHSPGRAAPKPLPPSHLRRRGRARRNAARRAAGPRSGQDPGDDDPEPRNLLVASRGRGGSKGGVR